LAKEHVLEEMNARVALNPAIPERPGRVGC
jgi:hypothetical protein